MSILAPLKEGYTYLTLQVHDDDIAAMYSHLAALTRARRSTSHANHKPDMAPKIKPRITHMINNYCSCYQCYAALEREHKKPWIFRLNELRNIYDGTSYYPCDTLLAACKEYDGQPLGYVFGSKSTKERREIDFDLSRQAKKEKINLTKVTVKSIAAKHKLDENILSLAKKETKDKQAARAKMDKINLLNTKITEQQKILNNDDCPGCHKGRKKDVSSVHWAQSSHWVKNGHTEQEQTWVNRKGKGIHSFVKLSCKTCRWNTETEFPDSGGKGYYTMHKSPEFLMAVKNALANMHKCHHPIENHADNCTVVKELRKDRQELQRLEK